MEKCLSWRAEIKKKKNQNACKASFLNFSIEVHYREFATKIFDKRDHFPSYVNACSIRTAIYNLKYFTSQSALKFYALPG